MTVKNKIVFLLSGFLFLSLYQKSQAYLDPCYLIFAAPEENKELADAPFSSIKIKKKGHAKKDFMSYRKAQQLIKEQGITTVKQFEKWSGSKQRPADFPSNPKTVYQTEWKDWKKFLQKKDFMSYRKAQQFIKEQGITTVRQFEEWKKLGKRPPDFPANPKNFYKTKWKGWKKFLQKKDFMSYRKAQQFIKEQGITTVKQFEKWSGSKQRPADFPSNPKTVYQTKWKGWKKFLQKKDFMSYTKAQQFIKEQDITTVRQFEEWKKLGKRPPDFPANPKNFYKTKWKGWGAFLGTNRKQGQKRKKI